METDKMKTNKRQSAYYLARVSVMAALAAVLFIFLPVPIPMFAPWLTVDFSDLPALIAGFSMGPVSGILVEAIKILLKIIVRPDPFTPVGEIANFLVGCAFIIPSALIYKNKRTFKRALTGLGIGFISFVLFSAAINWVIIMPLYAMMTAKFPITAIFTSSPAKLYDTIQQGLNGIFGYATSQGYKGFSNLSTYVFFACLPFNAIKGAILSLLTVLIYKRVSPILRPRMR